MLQHRQAGIADRVALGDTGDFDEGQVASYQLPVASCQFASCPLRVASAYRSRGSKNRAGDWRLGPGNVAIIGISTPVPDRALMLDARDRSSRKNRSPAQRARRSRSRAAAE